MIGVCLCTYMLFYSPLSNTVDVGSDLMVEGKGVTGVSEGRWNR